jgi:hypothetical protein
MTYDHTIISVESVSEGTYFSSWAGTHNGASTLVVGTWTVTDNAGTVDPASITLSAPDQPGQGPTGTGVLATIKAKANAEGSASLAFTQVIISGLNASDIGTSLSNISSPNGTIPVGASAAQTATAAATLTPPAASSTPSATPANSATAAAQATILATTPSPSPTPANSATAAAQATIAAAPPTPTPANSATALAQAAAATSQATKVAGQSLGKTIPGANGSAASGATGDNGGNGGADGGGSGSGGGADANGGGGTGSVPSNRIARIDLSKVIDEKGVVHQDVRVVDKTNTVQVFIPANTTMLTSDKRPVLAIDVTTLSDHPVTADGQFVIGSALDFAPDGATFSPPITIGVSFDPAKLPVGVSQSDLMLGNFDVKEGKWAGLDSTVDSANHVVSAQTTHFSTYSVLNKPPVSVNWGLLAVILLLEAAIAVFVYAYVQRRRRLAAARAALGDDGMPADEEDGFASWWFTRYGAEPDGSPSLVAALLTAPRTTEDAVDGEFVEDVEDSVDDVDGVGPSVNGSGDFRRGVEDDDNSPPETGHANVGR